MSTEICVHIPTALRAQAANQATVNLSGECIGEVLSALQLAYPALGQRLYKSDGALNRFINVYLNDEDIRFLDNLQTPVKAGDEVCLIPAIAGG